MSKLIIWSVIGYLVAIYLHPCLCSATRDFLKPTNETMAETEKSDRGKAINGIITEVEPVTRQYLCSCCNVIIILPVYCGKEISYSDNPGFFGLVVWKACSCEIYSN